MDKNEFNISQKMQNESVVFFKTLLSKNATSDLMLETLENFSSIKGIIQGLQNFSKEYRINYLDVLISQLYISGNFSEENVEQLKDRLQNDEIVKFYISRCLDIADRSNSPRAKAMLAIYSGRVINNTKLLESPESAVMLDILGNVNDFDLNHFEMIYKYMNHHNDCKVNVHEKASDIISFASPNQSESKNNYIGTVSDNDKLSFISSIKKLINNMALEQVTGTYESLQYFLIEKSPYSDKVMELCQEYKVLFNKEL